MDFKLFSINLNFHPKVIFQPRIMIPSIEIMIPTEIPPPPPFRRLRLTGVTRAALPFYTSFIGIPVPMP